jgi:hypothetical protein
MDGRPGMGTEGPAVAAVVVTVPACRPAARNGRGRILLRRPPQPARAGRRAAAALVGFCHCSPFHFAAAGGHGRTCGNPAGKPLHAAISYQAPTVYPPRVGTFAGRRGTFGPCPRTRPGAGSIVYQPVNARMRGKP